MKAPARLAVWVQHFGCSKALAYESAELFDTDFTSSLVYFEKQPRLPMRRRADVWTWEWHAQAALEGVAGSGFVKVLE